MAVDVPPPAMGGQPQATVEDVQLRASVAGQRQVTAEVAIRRQAAAAEDRMAVAVRTVAGVHTVEDMGDNTTLVSAPAR